jgi:metal-responsive CopG/Arc/MetJ family transcriptional regulator
MPAAKVSISLERGLLDAVDRVRGDVPRSKFIVKRLAGALLNESSAQGLTHFGSVSQKPSKKVVRNQLTQTKTEK